jgi:hypothetical protein
MAGSPKVDSILLMTQTAVRRLQSKTLPATSI